MKSWKTGLWLFAVNLYISTFTFGGGYIVIPMIRKIFVQQKQLFTESELLEMAAIAQSSPGAIAVNLSVLAGRRTLGMAGAWISAVGAVMPSFIILALISSCYDAFCGFVLEIPAMTLLLFWTGISLVLSFINNQRRNRA